MQLTTSGKRAFMSLPTVMAAMTFFTASFMVSRSDAWSSARSSPTSPAEALGDNEEGDEGVVGATNGRGQEAGERVQRGQADSRSNNKRTLLGVGEELAVLPEALHCVADALHRVGAPVRELGQRARDRGLEKRHAGERSRHAKGGKK